ncbi:diguanylate cyclase (GGDEF) domain-containing protein [Bosea lupini]|uniref:Diguanylate cyclase (GGDEF) domain-containing protein n=1 Tax=Bosea lupini TaxID=1036779 RepID=A0A1H7UY22_9HYPH|nr:GGDEF domain-containing phosphodiesterase [Bosea lupini]SEM01679.1 diguanylate cyclase (GGDEF) domain-containing protein [Bosea lupini]
MSAPSLFGSRDERIVEPRSLLSSIGEVAYSWDIGSDTLSWGPNAAEVLGPVPLAVLQRGLSFAGLVEPGSGRSRYDAIFSSGGHDLGDGAVYRTRYAADLAGRKMWIEDAGRWFVGIDGRPSRARGVLRLERAVRPEELTATDADLCDRNALVERVDEALAEHLPADRSVVVLVAAIGELARLNGEFGHEGTEEIIEEVRQRLHSVMRRRDQLMHYSGNRFAILLSSCPANQIEAAAERFIKAVARSAVESSRGIALVRLRVGAAIAPDLAREGATLVKAAESALSGAEAAGLDNAVIARRPVVAEGGGGAPRLDLEAVAALNERRVRLALQPVVTAKGRIPAFHEALLRVERPQGGFLAAAELVPLLERRGLVNLFDHRVLELAMMHLTDRQDAVLSINVSPRTLADADWIEGFEASAGASPGAAKRLIVEVTETATIEDPERMARLLVRIKQRGARVAIDDFGAGHTSLRHLRAFPIDILKLDGAFTQNLRRSTDDRFFVRTLLELAHHLGVETVAEWVDDELQASMLCDWGVTYLQGHLVGKAELSLPDETHDGPPLRAAG